MCKPMKWMFATFVASALLASPAFATCPPDGQTADSLQALKAAKFEMADADARKALATGLIDCLGDPDPVLRDDIAYSALSAWMRAGDFDADTLRAMRDALYAQLDGDDDAGFRRPYAALALSEVARTDRFQKWMTDEERAAMVEKAASYLESITDYRGFDDKEGWRHGIAHGSDWLMQLALNPALTRRQADRMLAAIATQVVPESAPAYVYGEGGRLARPILYLAKSNLYSQTEWTAWFATLPPKIGDASKAYNDSKWLARRHDLMAFLMSMYIDA
ncbi:MAG: DUF2785 domain-containing protein, partial [Lysobacteraceae bacterium]